ncbi:helix-turn-helix transcriptional regulator [Streptomyces roseirectus]|uniref:Helix-turn-helix transcriptional regulator n=1 Tax=Streptomyces roseirectus TaxID=2768066 RepID=A0A7H0ISV0_9ACTN|nr:helix-turn-helix transcriptional regulator [Streptomyces roseirectus]QNP75866.1 helix-turn-helix transcriptional regulator [Streptomyces roseirectus]
MNRKKLDPDSSPQAEFGAHLRKVREEQGLTQEEVADRAGFSSSHMSAVETARKKPTLQVARLVDRALGTGDMFERRWRQMSNGGVLEGSPQYIGHEAKAAEIRVFEVSVIPGLLQTPQYAAVIAQSEVKRGAITSAQAEERLALLAGRQASLNRLPSPLVVAVLDEACLRRPLGGPEVMNAQLDKLIEFAEMPNTHLQIAPFTMGERRPFDLPVYLLTLPDRTVLSYAESAHQGHLERDITFVLPKLTAYHQLQAEALSQAESVAMIRDLRKGSTP